MNHDTASISDEETAGPGRPNRRRLGWALLVGWLAYTFVLGALYVNEPPCPDNSAFDYIGWVASEGGTLYVDAADQNWPGQMLIHEASVLLFGNTIWSYRLFDFVVLLSVGCLLLLWFSRKHAGPVAGWLVVPIYQALYVSAGVWSSGQRDFVAAPLLVAAASCLLERMSGRHRRWLVAEGVLLGLAGFIRPTLLVTAPLLTLSDVLARPLTRRRWGTVVSDHCIVAVATLTPLALAAAIGASTGALSAWYEITVQFNLEVYSNSKTLGDSLAKLFSQQYLESFWWLVAVSSIGIVLYWNRARAALLVVGALLPAYLISFFVQGKVLGYHLTGLFALHALMMSAAIAWALGTIRSSGAPAVVRAIAGAAILLTALGLPAKVHTILRLQIDHALGRCTIEDVRRAYGAGDGGTVSVQEAIEIADYVAATTTPDQTVLFWARPSLVNFLAARRSPLRPAGRTLLVEPTPSFSRFAEWRDETARRLDVTPPELVLLIRREGGGYQYVPDEVGDHGSLGDVLRARLSGYELDRSFGRVDVLRRRRG